jgi:arginine exporter protein ArgO
MNVFKIIFALVLLCLAVVGGFALFGLVAWLFKYLIFFGIVLLVGAVAYKALKKGDSSAPYQLADHESDLARADRLLEELRRKQLTK